MNRPAPAASCDTSRLRLDCRQYRGDRPCRAGVPGVCPPACPSYDPMGFRILIIKLGALGDVIRTAALLPGLKTAWPVSHITWVSRPAGVRILAHHPQIDRLLPLDVETLAQLEVEHFDLVLSLDKEPGPAGLAMRVPAAQRRGIGLSRFGTVYPLNPECGPYFALGLDDELKFRGNTRSYPQLIYEAVGLPYAGQRYELFPAPADRAHAAAVWDALGVRPTDAVVGLNTGAGRVFANKNWPAERFVALARRLVRRAGVRVALLGGPDERLLNERIARACPGVLDTGGTHSELQFAALLERCGVVVTGDTMALHVAVALRVPVVALFGPTCPQEIDLFGRGEHIVTSLPCSPCYRRACDRQPNCMDDIALERVLAAVDRWLAAAPTAPAPAARPLPVLGAAS